MRADCLSAGAFRWTRPNGHGEIALRLLEKSIAQRPCENSVLALDRLDQRIDSA